MSRLKGLLRPLRTLFRKEGADREQREEMEFHLRMLVEQNIAAGMSAEEARRAAAVAFGGMERYREARRQASWIRLVEDLIGDVRHGVRSLGRRRGFTVAAALTLGLGIGGTAAIFSVVDGLFLRAPAGVRAADRLRRIYIARDSGMITTGEAGGPGSYVDFTALRDNVRGAGSIAAFLPEQPVDLGLGQEAEQILLGIISPDFFTTLGVRPEAGRFFLPEEDEEGGAPAAVVSHSFARRRWGDPRQAVSQTLLLDGQLVVVVGVTERGFSGLGATAVDAWMTGGQAPALGLGPKGWRSIEGMIGVNYVARLAPDADPAALEAEATTVLRHMAESYPALDQTPFVRTSSLVPGAGPNRGAAADLSLWLGAVALLVLVIACANVANLLLARGMTRRREVAVRLSLGATRGRIARQHLAESLILAFLGAGVGVLVAWWGLSLARRFPLPPSAGHLDGRLLLFAAGLALTTGLLFGLFPALRIGRVATVPALRESRLSPSAGGARARRILVMLQVALSVVLLVGAGLFVRSLRQVLAIDPGIDIDRIVAVRVDLQKAGYTPEQREQFYREAQAALRRLPAVESASMVHFAPFGDMAYGVPWELAGVPDPGFREGPYLNMAAPGYFALAGVRVIAGRDFMAEDALGEPTAIINERMARALAPDGRAVGLCVAISEQVRGGGCTRIVGVVENYRERYLAEADVPVIFLARDRSPGAISWGGPSLVARTRGETADAAESVRAVVQALRPDLPYVTVHPLEESIRDEILPYRLGATLFALFGALALILTAVGLYGVLGYFVTERAPEIGIRRSLGAPRGAVVRLVLRQCLLPVGAGVLAGLAAAWGGTRFIASLLFGVRAQDPAAFATAAGFLFAVACLATLLPARRAARVDPMIALRED